VVILKIKITLTKRKKIRIRTKLKKITNHKLGLKVKLKTNKIFIKGIRKKNQKSKR
jgi:hypothetical protein